MRQTFIFSLEPLDARYTKQWYSEVPKQLDKFTRSFDLDAPRAITVNGKMRTDSTTQGAFLNFADTNYWKSTQLSEFTEMMHKGQVPDDAVILFTDFWNPALIQVAYMRDLLDTNWSIHGIAHAGAYDPSDILGYKMRDYWPHNFERSLFYACDAVYFATKFHAAMFISNLDIDTSKPSQSTVVIAGQPYEYLYDMLAEFDQSQKTDTVMWPHRYNDDKQPEIAEDLTKDFDVFITQKHKLSKSEYYAKMAQSKVVFSCSLHENLGMSMIEGTLLGCIPIAPDRAAYSEIYAADFLYPSKWTQDYESYIKHRDDLVAFINERIDDYDSYRKLLPYQSQRFREYITPDGMFNKMMEK